MKTCGTCGAELQPEWQFCLRCGAEVPASASQPEPATPVAEPAAVSATVDSGAGSEVVPQAQPGAYWPARTPNEPGGSTPAAVVVASRAGRHRGSRSRLSIVAWILAALMTVAAVALFVSRQSLSKDLSDTKVSLATAASARDVAAKKVESLITDKGSLQTQITSLQSQVTDLTSSNAVTQTRLVACRAVFKTSALAAAAGQTSFTPQEEAKLTQELITCYDGLPDFGP